MIKNRLKKAPKHAVDFSDEYLTETQTGTHISFT